MLAADDPRHGTVAGYVAHGKAREPKCAACKAAYNRWEKRNRARMYLIGPASIDALPTQRRIRALVALGHTLRDQDAALGRRPGFTHYVLKTPTVRRVTAAAYHDLYERLCMTRPEGRKAERARRHAAKHGWPPPLAWLDIDNPDEKPRDWQYGRPHRHAQLDDVLAYGGNLDDACRDIGVNAEALEKWCSRRGRSKDYARLVARERGAA